MNRQRVNPATGLSSDCDRCEDSLCSDGILKPTGRRTQSADQSQYKGQDGAVSYEEKLRTAGRWRQPK